MASEKDPAILDLTPTEEIYLLKFAEVYPETLSISALMQVLDKGNSTVQRYVGYLKELDLVVGFRGRFADQSQSRGRPAIDFMLNPTQLEAISAHFQAKADYLDDILANLDEAIDNHEQTSQFVNLAADTSFI